MQTAEYTRFSDYVSRTTTGVDARAKRLAMFSHLDGRDVKSAIELAGRVNGNSKDRVWISQAIKAGEIVIANGALCLPEGVASVHEARALPKIRTQLSQIFDQLCEMGCPEAQASTEEGREYWSAGIDYLGMAVRHLGCSFDLDGISEEGQNYNKQLKKFYKGAKG